MRRLNNHVDNIVFKSYDPFSQFDSVKEIWTSLLKRCPHSYYLSWAWIETWIKSLPPNCNLTLVAGLKDESPVVAFFLGSKTTTRHKFFKFKQLSLNQTLIPYYDLIYIEYNAILIDPELTVPLELLLDLMPIKSWDEFRMIRYAPSYQPNIILNNSLSKKYKISVTQLKPYYVNLDKIRQNNNEYLTLLSRNKKQQLRRSIKEYEKMGEIRLFVAEDLKEALKIFDELTPLHRRRWTGLGYTDTLLNKHFIEFHKKLISRRFDSGEIQLMKVTAGNHLIGCLYNLIDNGRVLYYLSGFNYLPGNVYRPGLVCHYFAIIHNATIGLIYYDFLEGEDDYKISLSTDHGEMQDIIVRKKSIKSSVEEIAVKLYRLIKKKKNPNYKQCSI